MRAARGMWRWRRNPLRRPTDLAEAWAAAVAALLIVCAAPVVGWATGTAVHQALRETVRAQRAERHPVTATVVRVPVQPPPDPDAETAPVPDARLRVTARWTGPDGRTHRGTVAAPLPAGAAGDRFGIWTDGRGRPVDRPLDPAAAAAHAALAGLAAGLAAAGAVEGARRLAVRGLMRRRYTRWDAAWERAGQDWGRADASG
ncbi:hypothetical protein [Streptomyces sp. NPDC018031]|uniref:Rv1733c family protein n=1 Tax=Streptomyces sp. NPDC018031 TaxID=3365033 RepID=UPI0037BAE0D5